MQWQIEGVQNRRSLQDRFAQKTKTMYKKGSVREIRWRLCVRRSMKVTMTNRWTKTWSPAIELDRWEDSSCSSHVDQADRPDQRLAQRLRESRAKISGGMIDIDHYFGRHRFVLHDEDMAIVMILMSTGVWCAVQKTLFTCDIGEITKISILTSTMNGLDRMDTYHRAVFDMFEKLHATRRNAQANDRKDTRVLGGFFQSSNGSRGHQRRIVLRHFDRCRT